MIVIRSDLSHSLWWITLFCSKSEYGYSRSWLMAKKKKKWEIVIEIAFDLFKNKQQVIVICILRKTKVNDCNYFPNAFFLLNSGSYCCYYYYLFALKMRPTKNVINQNYWCIERTNEFEIEIPRARDNCLRTKLGNY